MVYPEKFLLPPPSPKKLVDKLHARHLSQIVGLSSESWFTRQDERAFVFTNGVMRELNNLVPANTGWVLNGATDINDAGQIVGNGKHNGQDRAFLLTPTQPILMTDANSNTAITVESVSFLAGPFHLTTPRNLGSDQRTRVTLLTRNVEVIPGENIASPSVQAEDIAHNVFSLPVEFVGKVSGAGWLTQIIVRLPDDLTTGDLQVSVTYRGRISNRGGITVLRGSNP